MITIKRVIATTLSFSLFLIFSVATPNSAAAGDQLQIRDRLQTQTPAALQTRDRLQTQTPATLQTRDRLQTQTPAALQTRDRLQTQTPAALQIRDQMRLHTTTPQGPSGGRR